MRLIDADWVLNALTVYGQSYDYMSLGRAAEVIEDAPTIDAEPVRRGRWIVWYHGGIRFSYTCSSCGMHSPNEQETSYCPYCGAKMEEQEWK